MPLRASWLAPFLAVLLAAPPAVSAANYAFTTFAGTPNAFGSTDGTGATARFTSPGAIAIDRAGNLYVTDDGSIRKITPTGVVSTLATNLQLFGELAVDTAENIFVPEFYKSTISKITPAGAVSIFAGHMPTYGQEGLVDGIGVDALFYLPMGFATDAAGNLFVGDTGNSALRKITPGGVVTTLAGGTRGSDPVDGLGRAAHFGIPSHLAIDGAGNVFVADSPSTIRKVTPAGLVTTVAGVAGQKGSADGAGSAVRFNSPAGIAFDAAGNLLIVDNGNAILRLMTPDGAVSTIAGQVGVRDTVDGVGGNARFNGPVGLAIDGAGNIYVADNAARVIRKGTPTSTLSPPIIQAPTPGSDGLTRNLGAGATFTLTAGASSTVPMTFQWTKNDAPIPGATSDTLTVTSASAADEGRYVFTATNAAGTISSTAFVVRVYTPTLSTFTTRHAKTGGSFLWGIASSGNQLVAVGTNGTILTSADGRAWTARDSGTTDWLVGVTYAAGKFVAVGDHGTILVSSDGAAWSRVASSGTIQRLNNVAWGGSTFVAVGEAGAIVTSTDARTWTARASGVTTWLRGVIYKPYEPPPPPPTPGNWFYSISGDNGSGRFYATGQNGVLLESAGGAVWQPSTTSLGPSNGSITLGKDIEILADGPMGIGQDGTVVSQSVSYFRSTSPGHFSSTGELGPGSATDYFFKIWRTANIGLNARFRGLARGAGAVFATGENGVIAAAADFSGPWAFIPSGTTANLVSSVFQGNSLFVVGENETILQSDPLYNSRLINVATRGLVAPNSPLISGFVLSGSTPKQVLIRAAGPALANFGFGGALRSPVLTLFDGAGRRLATNTGWSTATNAPEIATTAINVGAFPFATGSADSAVLVTLPPDTYTVQITSGDGSTALALVEVYDSDSLATSGSRAINLSTRGTVGTGTNYLVTGFVINGSASRRILIRGAGPSLASFGVGGVLAEPQLRLFDQRGRLLQTAGAWSQQYNTDELRAAAVITGAFQFNENSKDAAIVTTLLPGAYTVDVAGTGTNTGVALVEIYDLP